MGIAIWNRAVSLSGKFFLLVYVHSFNLWFYKQISKYNEKVAQEYQLDYHDNTVAFVALSSPTMFEKAFVPFLNEEIESVKSNTLVDPLDQCMRKCFSHLKRVSFLLLVSLNFQFLIVCLFVFLENWNRVRGQCRSNTRFRITNAVQKTKGSIANGRSCFRCCILLQALWSLQIALFGRLYSSEIWRLVRHSCPPSTVERPNAQSRRVSAHRCAARRPGPGQAFMFVQRRMAERTISGYNSGSRALQPITDWLF